MLKILQTGIRNLCTSQDAHIAIAYLGLTILFYSVPLLSGRLPGPFEYLGNFAPYTSPEFTNRGNFYQSDVIDQVYPSIANWRASVLGGRNLFWDNKRGFGYPYLVNISGTFSLVNLLTLVTPFEYHWFVSVLIRYVLVGFFTYKLLQLYLVENSIAFLGGLAMMLSFYFVAWSGTVVGDTLGAIPLFLYGGVAYLKAHQPTRIQRFIFFLGTTNLLLSSFIPIIFYVAVVSVVYVITSMRHHLLTTAKGWLLLGLIVCSLCVSIIPNFYTLTFLQDVAIGGRTGRGLDHAPIAVAYKLIFPEIFGEYDQIGARLADVPFNYTETANYVGIFFVYLACVNLLLLITAPRYRRHEILFWTAVQLISFMLTFNVLGILQFAVRIPGFNFASSLRIHSILTISSVIVGVLVLQAVVNYRLVFKRHLLWGAISAILITLGYTLAVNWSFVSNYNDTALHIALHVGILGLSLLFLFIAITSPNAKNYAVLGMIIVHFGGAFDVGADYNSNYIPKTFYPRSDVLMLLQSELLPGERILQVGLMIIPHHELLLWYFKCADVLFLSSKSNANFCKHLTQILFGGQPSQDILRPL